MFYSDKTIVVSSPVVWFLLKAGTKPLQSFSSLCYTATVESQSGSEILDLEEFLCFQIFLFRAKTK